MSLHLVEKGTSEDCCSDVDLDEDVDQFTDEETIKFQVQEDLFL